MKEKSSGRGLMAIGLAMFSMFFGSGNIVFPVLVGQLTQAHASFAMLGLLLTAVAVPFFGLLTLSLYDGNYLDFFKRLGRTPGWVIVLLIMALLGPFAVIPRCIVIAHATVATFVPSLSLPLFSAGSCLIIYFCTYKPRRIIEILGLYLTPALLLALSTIIVRGLSMELPASSASKPTSPGLAVIIGLREGYNTMDLFAAFLFSSVALASVKQAYPGITANTRHLLAVNMKASVMGMGLLATIYWGMCSVAARHAASLSQVSNDQLLSQLTLTVLGPQAGIIVCLAVSLACLTTAISLALVFTEFVCRDVCKGKCRYAPTLLVSLVIACVISMLRFTGIQAILAPILKLSLPALMVLTLANFLHKVWGFKPVRGPVVLTFLVTIAYYWGS